MAKFLATVRKGGKSKTVGISADSKAKAKAQAKKAGYTVSSIHPEDEDLEILGAEEEVEDDDSGEDNEVEILSIEEVDEPDDEDDEPDDEEDEPDDEDDEPDEDDAPSGKSFAAKFLGG